MIALSLLSFVVALTIGLAVMPNPRQWTGQHRAASAFSFTCASAFGLGLTSCTLFLCASAGLPRHLLPWISDGLALGLALSIRAVLIRATTHRFSQSEAPREDAPTSRLVTWLRIVAALIFIGAFSLTTLGAVEFISSVPHGGSDAFALWNYKARCLYFGADGLRALVTPPLFHRDYPLLLPATIARGWLWIGDRSVIVQMAVAGYFLGATVVVLLSVLHRLRSWTSAFLGGAVLLSAVVYPMLAATQQADIPLSFWIVLTLSLVAMEDRVPEVYPKGGQRVLAGLSAGLASWTKNEGLLFLVCLLLTLIVIDTLRLRWREMFRGLWPFLFGVTPGLIAVVVLKRSVDLPNDMLGGQSVLETTARLTDLTRYGVVADSLLNLVMLIATPPILIGLLIASLAFGFERPKRIHRPTVIVIICLSLHASGMFLAYVVTPHDLTWQLATSGVRLLAHLWPAAIVTLFLVIQDPEVLSQKLLLPEASLNAKS